MRVNNLNDLSNEKVAMSDERKNKHPNSLEKEVWYFFLYATCSKIMTQCRLTPKSKSLASDNLVLGQTSFQLHKFWKKSHYK